MEAFLVSTGVVALAEMGDKTQLLAFVLAARFRRPWIILWGILCATIVNHALAGAAGVWIADVVPGHYLRWVLGFSFLAMAVWTLIPDKIDEDEKPMASHLGVFGATFITFFFAEMADKTQIATIALAANFDALFAVVAGTTLGMLIADGPAIFLGQKFAHKIPLKWVHGIAAAIFAIMGLLVLFEITAIT